MAPTNLTRILLPVVLPLLISCGSSGNDTSSSGSPANNGGSQGSPPGLSAADFEGSWFGLVGGSSQACTIVGSTLLSEIQITFHDGLPRSEGSDLFDYLVNDFEAEVEITLSCSGDVYFARLLGGDDDTGVTWDQETGILSIGYREWVDWFNRTNTSDTWDGFAFLSLDLVLNSRGELEILFGEVKGDNNALGNHGRTVLLGELLSL